MQKSALFFITCFLGLSVSGCASLFQGQQQPAAEPGSGSAATDRKANTDREAEIRYTSFEPEVLYLLLSAEIAAQRGQYNVTLGNYLEAARQSRDQGVIARTLRIAQSLNNDSAQQEAARLLLDVEPETPEAHRALAIQAMKASQLQTALRHMETIMDLGADANFDHLAANAGNLPAQQREQLLKLYQQLAERHPDTPEIEYSIALLMKVTGRPQQGLDRLDPLLREHPNFQPAIILKGDLLHQTGKTGRALDYLLKNTRRFPANRQMGMVYGQMLVTAGELQAAQDEFQRLTRRFPDFPRLRLSHALVALENNQLGVAREELSRLAEQGHHLNEAHYYLGRIAEKEGNPSQAIEFYDEVDGGDRYFSALGRASALRAETGRLEDALAAIRELRSNNPSHSENFWLLEINLLLKEQQQQAALKASNEALAAHPDNVSILYARAMLHDTEGRPAKAEADLRRILELDPQNAVALNALGYILATRTDRLTEAESYVRRALELDPANPAILDSMGWVLYLQGEKQEALDYLRRAWQVFPDPEVAAHYGEALWQTGSEDQARLIWEKGLDSDPDHPVLIETIRRLEGGQQP